MQIMNQLKKKRVIDVIDENLMRTWEKKLFFIFYDKGNFRINKIHLKVGVGETNLLWHKIVQLASTT